MKKPNPTGATTNSGGTAASPKRVTAQTIEDSNWLKRYLRGDFRVKPNPKGGLSGPTSAQIEASGHSELDGRRFECTCDARTLRIVDAGICLVDHRSGQKGDQYFTLESLPGVIQQAEREGKLVVFRRV